MLDLLLETELTAEQKEYLDDARLCAENLLEILNSTLEFSALAADQVVLEEAEFPLRSMLADLLDDFEDKARGKALRLLRHFSPDVPEIAFGDALRLQQIVSQLVANAIKFTTRGEVEVKVSTGPVEDSRILLSVKVRDTGIGISEDKLDRIFDSFRQLETGLARRYTGIGLGLAVTQKLVQLMSGDIGVSSRIGEGTEFSLDIPLHWSRETTTRPAAGSGSVHRFNILVVEDNPIAQIVALHVLHRRPYHVYCASSGPEALQAARNDRYDLVLMDLQMPEMDGFETAGRMRDLAGYRNTPIVALTANCSAEYRDQCFRRGMQGFISKPVQSSELLRTVESFLPVPKGPSSLLPPINSIAM